MLDFHVNKVMFRFERNNKAILNKQRQKYVLIYPTFVFFRKIIKVILYFIQKSESGLTLGLCNKSQVLSTKKKYQILF